MKKMAENSLACLIPAASRWKNKITKPIRIPISITNKVLEYAHKLDEAEENEIEDIEVVSKKQIFDEIEKVKHSKQSLKIGIERLEAALIKLFKKGIDKDKT